MLLILGLPQEAFFSTDYVGYHQYIGFMNVIKTAGGGSCLMKSLSGDLTGETEESNVNI